jgi:ADP-heptose:LPS heptosyltransferase
MAVYAGKLAQQVFEAFAPALHLRLYETNVPEFFAVSPPNEQNTELIVHLRGDINAVRATWNHCSARFVCGLPRRSRLRWAPLYYLGLPAPPSREHQYDTFRRMMRSLGIELPAWPRVMVRREWRESLTEKLRAKGIEQKRLAVLHLLAAWSPRAWPLERWHDICVHLREDLNLEVCLVGGPEDAAALAECLDMPFPVSVLAGELSLGELAALCERSVLFVGNDSGPAHLAAAAGARCVVIYGPQDAALFGVRSNKVVTVQGRSFCTPCWQTVCPFGRARCLDSISVDTVQSALRSVLALLE